LRRPEDAETEDQPIRGEALQTDRLRHQDQAIQGLCQPPLEEEDRKRRLGRPALVDATNVRAVKRLIPYG